MGIEFQYGTASMYAQAAQMVGEAQAARQNQAMELEKQRQTADIEMMQFREQLGIQAEQRSQQWELQKMEMRSQSDFALEERKRQILAERDLQKQMKIQDEVEAGIKIIQESPHLSAVKDSRGVSAKDKAIYAFVMEKQLGYTVPRETGGLDLSQYGSENLTPDEPVVEEPRGIVAGTKKFLNSGVSGWPSLGGSFGGGMTLPENKPAVAQPAILRSEPSMRLTDSDKEKLQGLDESSRKSLETVLASGNPQLIQAALTRIRNL